MESHPGPRITRDGGGVSFSDVELDSAALAAAVYLRDYVVESVIEEAGDGRSLIACDWGKSQLESCRRSGPTVGLQNKLEKVPALFTLSFKNPPEDVTYSDTLEIYIGKTRWMGFDTSLKLSSPMTIRAETLTPTANAQEETITVKFKLDTMFDAMFFGYSGGPITYVSGGQPTLDFVAEVVYIGAASLSSGGSFTPAMLVHPKGDWGQVLAWAESDVTFGVHKFLDLVGALLSPIPGSEYLAGINLGGTGTPYQSSYSDGRLLQSGTRRLLPSITLPAPHVKGFVLTHEGGGGMFSLTTDGLQMQGVGLVCSASAIVWQNGGVHQVLLNCPWSGECEAECIMFYNPSRPNYWWDWELENAWGRTCITSRESLIGWYSKASTVSEHRGNGDITFCSYGSTGYVLVDGNANDHEKTMTVEYQQF